LDEHGTVLPAPDVGEICVRTQSTCVGYYNNPEKTSQAFTPGGWYRSGDMGRMTDKGQLVVLGRRTDIIRRGGNTVLAAAVENVIKTCPGVDDVIAVGVPDDRMYLEICACVINKPDGQLTVEKIEDFCKQQFLADNVTSVGYGCLPKYYLLFENFPLTATGKVDRMAVAAEAAHRITIQY
jgi:acyl-CoA synthetase (AMP-forming)/AMP-acid ligase II